MRATSGHRHDKCHNFAQSQSLLVIALRTVASSCPSFIHPSTDGRLRRLCQRETHQDSPRTSTRTTQQEPQNGVCVSAVERPCHHSLSGCFRIATTQVLGSPLDVEPEVTGLSMQLANLLPSSIIVTAVPYMKCCHSPLCG